MKKKIMKSELFREGYIRGLKKALSLIEKIIDLKLANDILLESFKDDVLNGYKKLGYNAQDKNLLNAINTFNSENLIKELIKKEIGKVPNVGIAVAKMYSPEKFIDFVYKAQQNINIKQLQQQEKELRKQKAASSSDKYFIYPCRTFEEVHRAAFSHTGNLKKLSREERERFFKELYDIEIPKRNSFYKTDKSPALMLYFMKECPVFMEPTWCVCGAEKFWNDYRLKALKNEDAKCFVVISKTFPNVRFCVTINKHDTKKVEGDYVILKKVSELGEFRDIWQIGGRDVQETGMEMAKLAFGDISGLLNNISKVKYERTPIGEITNGNRLFDSDESLTSFNKKLSSLINGIDMFNDCYNLKSFTSELPKLTNGSDMFNNCTNLSSFTIELPSLTYGMNMFCGCDKLLSFTSELPSLVNGSGMFCGCTNLKSFTSKLPNLINGSLMFEYCDELSSFTIELPKLTDGEHVFYGCTNLKSFTSKLPKLTNGFGMFEDCKLDKPSVINILTSIPQCKSCISISTGYDYTKDEDTLQAIKEAENKGWEVEIEYNH